MSEPFVSGRVGYVGPRRAMAMRALDRALDAALRLRGVPHRLDRLAERVPRRRVLALCVYRARSSRVGTVPAALSSERHEPTLAFGSMGRAELREHTVASHLRGGKFENLNAILQAGRIAAAEYDWLLVIDDDVALPARFLDRLLGVCERLDLALAQPAQTLASHAAWPVTRRHAFSVARETRFVEIGPVFAMRSDAVRELVPFPDLRFGWGLELHWAALAGHRGWRLGVIDALPVRHEEGGVASAYRHDEAVAEARRFLDGRPYLPGEEAARTVAVHRRLR